MTRYVPYVVLVPEGLPDAIAARVDRLPASQRNRLAPLCDEANGWTLDMLLAGAYLTYAIDAAPEPRP